jgi:hypothetical protein
MSQKISLKETERRAFRASFQDGLWDVLLGCYVSMLAVAPLLSDRLGDFWSSAIFVPFWALVWAIIWALRRYVVAPRVGRVRFGPARMRRLSAFTAVMLVVNVAALILGALAAAIPAWQGLPSTVLLGVVLWFGFSLAGYFLDFSELYLYGILIALAFPIGEWLWRNRGVPHHGFPVTFGLAAGLMILIGLVKFVRLVGSSPIAGDEAPVRPANG